MARKPKSIGRVSKVTERVFDEKAFVDGVFNDEYILVVGNGVILDRTKFPQSEGDINKYIISEINNDRSKERAYFVNHRTFTDVFRGTSLDEIDPIYSLLTDGYKYALTDISPELTLLLRTKLFRFVLTTCIDSYIETLMRDIWGDELRIVNISDNQSLKDFQNALAHSRSNRYFQPTLFYVFGKVVEGRPKPRGFVETDVDAIKIIEKWITDIDYKYIVPFLKEKRMLALGCKFDDWYFRFFWYILTRGFEDTDREGIKDIDGNLLTCDNLAVIFDPGNPSDMQLKEYLIRRGVCIHSDVWQFMTHIHTLLTSTDLDSPFLQMVLEKRRQGGIFISYKSCDVLVASELFCKLARENELNVWFDNIKLYGGDNYKQEIRDAIKKSRIFIPILSSSIEEDIKNHGEKINTFYSDEWRWAAEKKDIVVIPYVIDGYDIRGEAKDVFERIIKQTPSGIEANKHNILDSGEKVGYTKLLESIKKHLELL